MIGSHWRWTKNSIRPPLSIMLEVMLVHFACLNRSVQSCALGIGGIHTPGRRFLVP